MRKKLGVLIVVAGIAGLMGGYSANAASREVRLEYCARSDEEEISLLDEIRNTVRLVNDNPLLLNFNDKLDDLENRFNCHKYVARAFMMLQYLSEEKCKSLLFDKIGDYTLFKELYKPYYPELYLWYWVSKNIIPISKDSNSIAIHSILMGLTQKEMKEMFIKCGN